MTWTDERVELLKKLWADGLSASQIAAELGGITRNAVIGKVHRLGLSGRATTSRMKSHRPRARAQSTRRLMKPRFANIGNPALRQLYLGDTEPYTPPAEELVIPLNERTTALSKTARIGQFKRCPGGSEQAAVDGSNVWSAADQHALDCKESARATGPIK